ncbi:KilA-N domain-containing protein [Marinomonas aquiplantarum]|uniref:KilA domain-containing protein n=1 Tax=Marinomonas aquiplantarum TaxID=491951 RepID=A0A366D010_9GAMM|nr:KilA-N domain-containing protein [Marinomonas aquiplantarum]RBO82608.1 KilA domain-containing protein [Marinomonas aquiplantarum]
MAHLMIASKDIRTLDGLYSLNDLHKAAGSERRHLPAQFLRNNQTRELIDEIENYANSHSLVIKKTQGRNGGTYVCKELVYAYAMWISPKFNLEVIRAFDQSQTEQPPEPTQQSLPNPIQDDEKLKLINDVAKSLGIIESIAVVSATDIMDMVQTIRNYQQLAKIQTNPAWVDQTIERIKNATGKHFGEG